MNEKGLEERIKQSLVWLEIAKKDLEAAKYLYSHNLFPHAVFFLQQSIEKMTKSFGIRIGVIDEEEAKSIIGHEVWRIFLKILEKTKKETEEIFNRFPGLKNVSVIKSSWFSEITNLNIEELKREFSKQKLLELSSNKENLENIIDKLVKMEKEFFNLKDLIPKYLYEKIPYIEKEIKDYIKKIIQEIIEEISKTKSIDKDTIEAEIDKLITSSDVIKNIIQIFSQSSFWELKLGTFFCCYSLYYLSQVFCSHTALTRYPEEGRNPLEVYNKEAPLVQKLNDFIYVVEVTLNMLNRIYEILESSRTLYPSKAETST